MQAWQTTCVPKQQKTEGIFSLVTKPHSQDIKQNNWRSSSDDFSSLWQMKGTKENMTPSGRLRTNNHRCWLPKPCSQASQFKIYFHKRFSPATVNLEREGQGEIFILLFWRCTTGRELGERHGEDSYLLPVYCQLSHISAAVSRESGVFWVFTVPSTILETVQEETCVSFHCFQFLAGAL